ncbi:MAG: flavodoxin family protein [Tissierellia bacterium]|nr:flavodoxin family protein [Tissierellia bacterium]
MKGLISYSSRTGNTKKLAETIYEHLSSVYDLDIKSVKETFDPKDYDFILHGIWVRMTGLDKDSKKFLSHLPKGMKVGIFGTSGGEHASAHSKRLDDALKHAENPFESLGTKLTYGKVDPSMISKIDGIIGNLLPKKMKSYIKEMSLHSREATEEERLEVADYFKNQLQEKL